ncbi:hypothetical protein U91I_03748 [alpha proteobacterium U9-1i]|nr:hypothetical protein U91I_03748 [alpha proteobacterium U9-1i]
MSVRFSAGWPLALHANGFERYASCVIDFDAARKIAGDHIREGETQYEGGPDGVLRPVFTPVIVDSQTQELDFGWVFFQDSEEHQKTGGFRLSLIGNAPIVVDRADGSVHPTGTARSLEYYVEEYKRKRQRG